MEPFRWKVGDRVREVNGSRRSGTVVGLVSENIALFVGGDLLVQWDGTSPDGERGQTAAEGGRGGRGGVPPECVYWSELEREP